MIDSKDKKPTDQEFVPGWREDFGHMLGNEFLEKVEFHFTHVQTANVSHVLSARLSRHKSAVCETGYF